MTAGPMTGQAPADRLPQLDEAVLAMGNLVESIVITAAGLLHGADVAALEGLATRGTRCRRRYRRQA